MTLQVRVATPAELPAVYALRHEVFVVGQNVPPEIERDELDATALHVLAYDDDSEVVAAGPDRDSAGGDAGAPPALGYGTLLGTGRLVGELPGPARVGRMAVRAAARGRGVGVGVLRVLEREGMLRGHHEVVLHAQVHARGFYDRAGYDVAGPEFFEAGIAHVAMRRELPEIRPVADSDGAPLAELIGGVWAEYPGCVLDIDGEEPWLRAPATAYAAKRGRMWVVELDGKVVACVGIRPIDDQTAELKSLYVAATARRRGLGEALTELVERTATGQGAGRIELWSDTRFADAHRLYRRLGYQRLLQTRDLHDLSDTAEYAYAKALPRPPGR